MTAVLLLLATFAIAALGFAMAALSQKQHWQLLHSAVAAPEPPRWLRAVGWFLIGLAVIPAIARDSLAFGLLLWATILTMSGLLVIACLTWLRGVDNW